MNYYNKNFKEYHEKTIAIDPSTFLEPAIKYFRSAGLILDIGCGSGRDIKWLKKRGFETVGFENSSGLVRLAGENARSKIIEGDFETYDFSDIMADVIILVGSLVHVPHNKMILVLSNIIKGLSGKKTDCIFLTLKKGAEKKINDNGRIFYLWENNVLRKIFDDLKLEVACFFEK